MKATILGVLLLAPYFLFAQQPHRCASHDIISQWEAQYPGTTQALDAVLKTAQQHSKTNSKRDGSRSGDTIYRIPVVVHIVYATPQENLDDSLVHNQIEALNKAFRRENWDTIVTRTEFKPFAGDAGIEFYLADLDPDGNPTTGITRTAGTPPPLFGYTPFGDEVKKNSAGGKDPWPTDRYLNLWVCNLFNGFGVLGYAYPPVGNLASWPAGSAPADTNLQGVVIYHKVFGVGNPLALSDPNYRIAAQGKTTIHEIGHYLGLRHIWGDGPCNEDDFVGDTPPGANASQQTCVYTTNECSPSCPLLPDYPNMIENYMDYSPDSCLNMFTHGQIEIMRGVLATFRSRLPEITFGTIKPSNIGLLENTFIANTGDSLVVVIDYTRWLEGGIYPYTFATGDSLTSSATGGFTAADCQEFVLYPGDYIVNAAGDTLFFSPGDTVTTYNDGTVQVKPYREIIGVGNVAQSMFKIYPNPTTGMVYLNAGPSAEAQRVSIVNLLGEVVLTQGVSAQGITTLDVNHLATGIYLVQVQGANATATQRLVVE